MKIFKYAKFSIFVSMAFLLGLTGCASDEPTNGLEPEGPKVAVSPQPYVYFGQIPSGQSAIRSFNLANTGGQTLIVNNLTIGGTNSGQFSLIDVVLPVEIPAYTVESIQVSFQPNAIGSYESSISIVSNAPTSPDKQDLVGSGSSSASGSIYFERVFKGNASSVRLASDNGYIAAGNATDTTTLDPVGALTRLDEYGNIIWINGFAGTQTSEFSDVIETLDGGFVAVGTTGSSVTSKRSIYIVKTDVDGNLAWDQIHSLGGRNDEVIAIEQASDGGFILAGNTQNTDGSENVRDALLLKIDAGGNVIWDQKFGSASEGEDARSVVETEDQGFVFVGSQTTGASGFDLYMVRTNADGSVKWEKKYGGANWDIGNSVIGADQGNFIAAGYTISEGAGGRDVYMIKTDSSGTLKWSKTFGGGSDDQAEEIIRTNDQGYILAGMSESFGDLEQVYLVKTDNNGNLSWEKNYGGVDEDGSNSIRKVKDEGYIIAGYTRSFSTGNEAYLLKVDNTGSIR